MIIAVDLSTVPPRAELREPEDFGALKVVVTGGHAFITRDTLIALAAAAGDGLMAAGDGPAAQPDPAWVSRLDAMLAYAAGAGWVDDAGAVRAHIEFADSASS